MHLLKTKKGITHILQKTLGCGIIKKYLSMTSNAFSIDTDYPNSRHLMRKLCSMFSLTAGELNKSMLQFGGYYMSRKNQSNRLTSQHKESHGEIGIFGTEAKEHDSLVGSVSKGVINKLKEEYPYLSFRYRTSIKKEEINEALQKIDKSLGQTLFLNNASIKPDGGLVEVRDDNGEWRVILVSEAKFQGKDIDNLRNGKLVGKNNNQDLMAAGNAIERSHKNISEIANFMLGEIYFPYILFLEGSNFLTENVSITRPDGSVFVLQYDSGTLNRIDRLTAANYGMPLNTNLCENKFVKSRDKVIIVLL